MNKKLFIRLKAIVVAVIALMIGILLTYVVYIQLDTGAIPIDSPVAKVIMLTLFIPLTIAFAISAALWVIDAHRPRPPKLTEAEQAQAGFAAVMLFFPPLDISPQKNS